MRRAGLLYCAEVDVPRFTVLRQRNQLPFDTAANEGAEKWANYTLAQAFRLRLLCDLIGGEAESELSGVGIAPQYAAKILDNTLNRGISEGIDLSAPGTFAGVAVVEELQEDGSRHRFTRWFCADISALPGWLSMIEQRDASSTVRLFLVNTARAAASVRLRAHEFGLPEAADSINVAVI